MRYETRPSFYWAADAYTLIQQETANLDWERMISLAVKRRLVFATSVALRYLRDALAAPVPESVLTGLRGAPMAAWEQTEHLAKQAPATLIAELRRCWHAHSRIGNGRPTIANAVTFPQFMQVCWNLENAWQVPLLVPLKVSRRLGRRVTAH